MDDRSTFSPSLWGGQDGSLLWWLFLLSIYTAVCVCWLKGRFRELQPYIIATLMVIVLFFCVLMTFAANPFSTSVAGARIDGEGLNPLLQNFYMIIHPPSLYTGFVGCSVPFAFAVAALVTGRLDNEWVAGVRNWMLFAWMFLSIGNALGMLWAYEELGWGGYWAWDPVENAAFLPWLTATAFVHSMMIQERRGMLKVWNVSLVLLTFFLTIFGTFLTRSGLIASVHSFAQSNIGIYFVWFLGILIAACAGLVVWRLPRMRSEGRIEAVLSREAAFLANNWAFLGIMVFILVATTFPRISEWLMNQQSTVGPTFYNAWLPPAGLFLFALMGMGPLLAWRKTSPQMFKRGFVVPDRGRPRRGDPARHVRPIDALSGLRHARPHLRRLRRNARCKSSAPCCRGLDLPLRLQRRGRRTRVRARHPRAPARRQRVVLHCARRTSSPKRGTATAGTSSTSASSSCSSASPGDRGASTRSSLKPGETFQVDHYQMRYVGPAHGGRPDQAHGLRRSRGHRHVHRRAGRQRQPGQVHLPQDARIADHRSLDAALDSRRPLRRRRNGQPRDQSRHVPGARESAGLWIWVGVLILIFGIGHLDVARGGGPRGRGLVVPAHGGRAHFDASSSASCSRSRLAARSAQSSSLHAGSVEMNDPTEHALFGSLLCHVRRLRSLAAVHLHVQHRRRYTQRNPLQAARRARPSTPSGRLRERVRSGGAQRSAQQRRASSHLPGALGLLSAASGSSSPSFVAGSSRATTALRLRAAPGASGRTDEYDDKLDEELKKLDDDRPR